jgi:hypothetical protein
MPVNWIGTQACALVQENIHQNQSGVYVLHTPMGGAQSNFPILKTGAFWSDGELNSHSQPHRGLAQFVSIPRFDFFN